jgi:hypothetical protein
MTDNEDHFLAVVRATADLTPAKLSATAVAMLAADLADYPREQVLAALRRCRREGVKRLTLADVISRIDDGRPAPDEAWAMLPKDATGSVVWCEEMAQALRQAQGLIDAGDWMAARVVFKEGYARIAEVARGAGVAPVWTLRQGSDPDALQRALLTGIAHGRVTSRFAMALCPELGMKSIPIYPLSMGMVPMLHEQTTEAEETDEQ